MKKLERWIIELFDLIHLQALPDELPDYIIRLFFLKRVNDQFFEEARCFAKQKNIDIDEVLHEELYFSFFLPEAAYWSEIIKQDTDIAKSIDIAFYEISKKNLFLEDALMSFSFDIESLNQTNRLLKSLLNHFSKYKLSNSNFKNISDFQHAVDYLFENSLIHNHEFNTPKAISKLLTELVSLKEDISIYDPTCGAGNILIQASKCIGKDKVRLYAQEINLKTYSLCKIHLYLNELLQDSDIRKGNVLSSPKHTQDESLETFDVILSQPPFSIRNWSEYFDFDIISDEDKYGRFKYGIPPQGNADYFFIEHIIASLNKNGKAGIIMPSGILFRGGKEGKIRANILNEDLIEGIVALPSKLFNNTAIPINLIIINKSKPNNLKNKVIFIDASSEYYKVSRHINSISKESIDKITTSYNRLKTIENLMAIESIERIRENDYNLNVKRYINKENN